jgi:ABC-type antimicrobial peptide transport system permease subunit
LGVLLLAQGLTNWSVPVPLADFFRSTPAWQSLPVLGGLSPMELSLTLALGRFTAGVFLIGGFITRGMALLALLFAVLLVWLGAGSAESTLLNAVAAALALSILVFGGGGRTLDGVLGRMQRRALEKENIRQAEREAARRRQAES